MLVLAICAATFAGGAYAYGVDVKKSLTRRVPSTCVPINSRLYRMVQPDGVERIFSRDWDDPNLLHCGKTPWIGVIRPEHHLINICTEPAFKGEKTEFCFLDGALRFMSVGAKDYSFDPEEYQPPAKASEFSWLKTDPTPEEMAAVDMWRGAGRFRFLSRNPNRTALVCAQVALVFLGLTLFATSGVWRVHALLLTIISTLLLFQTQSRGGLLGFAFGVFAMFCFRWKRGISRRAVFAIAAGCLLVGGFAAATKLTERILPQSDSGSNQLSSQNRLYIWKEVPRMIAAAPLGWGWWQSGSAYNSWYEIRGRMHMVGDLFNDHFSRFVEGGFVMGGLYVAIWAWMVVWCFRLAWHGGTPIPLALISAYFISSAFNPMNYWRYGFCIPAVALLWAMIRGWRWLLVRKTIVIAGVLSVFALSGVGLAAWSAPAQDVPLRVGWMGRRIVVGKGEPKVWVVDDGYVLNGDYFGFPGKELRDYYAANPDAEALGLVSRLEDLPDEMERLVVTGTQCRSYLERHAKIKAPHVILMTPPFASSQIPEDVVCERDLHVVTGEFVARATGDWARREPWLVMVPGAEVYIPGWLNLVVGRRT